MLRSMLAGVMLAVSLTLIVPPQVLAGPFRDDAIQVTINGYYLALDVAPVLEGGRVLVPFRAVAEFYDFTVDYRTEDQTIAVTGQGRKITMQVDQASALIDGTAVVMDVPPRVVAGRTLVPLRFVGESLGLDVDWDAEINRVRLSGPGPVAPVPPSVSLNEIRTVRRGNNRWDQRQYRTFTDVTDPEAIANLAWAWNRAIPTDQPELTLPMPPYGIYVAIGLETGHAAVTLPWVCLDGLTGERGCTPSEGSYVYLSRDGWPEVLVYSPTLAELVRHYPLADEQ